MGKLSEYAKVDTIKYYANKYTKITTYDTEDQENIITRADVDPMISGDGLSLMWSGLYVNTTDKQIVIASVGVLDQDGNILFKQSKVQDKYQDNTTRLNPNDKVDLKFSFAM